MINDTRGDIYTAQKDYTKAKKAYSKAISETLNPEELSPMVQIKLDNLPSQAAGDQSL
jgi:predicted negative regulator of RcsB-dependent stress response